MKFKAIICTNHGDFIIHEDDEKDFQLIGNHELIYEAKNITSAKKFFTELINSNSLWKACILNDDSYTIKVIEA